VDINKEKGPESWKYSVKRINTPIERTLMMGDSLVADILAGIAAGCRNIVWVNGDLNKLPLWVREDTSIHIWCVDSVRELIVI
jgi:FMN phosphatase YigB (HAD superfamily)